MSLFNTYLDDYIQESESPTIYHRWSMIGSVAALLGRNFYLPFGHGCIYPNQFAMLIGSPGARKSTAISIARKLVSDSGYDYVAASKTSKEKFLLDLYGAEEDTKDFAGGIDNLFDDADADIPHEAFIAADEFTNFTGSGNFEFFSLLGELWDCPASYTLKVKNSKSFTINQPVVNLLGGNTQAGFAAAFPPEILGQGFLSRMLLIYGESDGTRITWPKPPCPELRGTILESLQAIRLKIHGEATMTPEAREAIDWIYQNAEDLEDSRLKHYCTRRIVHLIKLCLIHCAARLDTEITLEDVILSNTVLTHAEELMPTALGEFGKSKNSEVTAEILTMLGKAARPLTIRDIWKQVQPQLERFQLLPDIMAGLLQADKVQQVHGGFLLKLKARTEEGKYLDFSLLQERRGRKK